MPEFTEAQLIARMQIRLAIVNATISRQLPYRVGRNWYILAGGNEAPFRTYAKFKGIEV